MGRRNREAKAEIDALKDANQKLYDEKFQIAYNHELHIVQNMKLCEED